MDPLPSTPPLTHLDSSGRPTMVDVGGKAETEREAVAEGWIVLSPSAVDALKAGRSPKGDPLLVAQIAGIQAAKRTGELIPLCHPLPLSKVDVQLEFDPEKSAVRARALVKVVARTGVEMEALTAVSVALLTVYDMLKAVDREMRIEGIRLVSKKGGRSGTFDAESDHR